MLVGYCSAGSNQERGCGEVGNAGGQPGTFHTQAVAGSFKGDLFPYLSDGC